MVTIALVLKAKALMSCLFDVISFTRSLNESGETSTILSPTSSVFASINALVSSSLSYIIVTPPHTTPTDKRVNRGHKQNLSLPLNFCQSHVGMLEKQISYVIMSSCKVVQLLIKMD